MRAEAEQDCPTVSPGVGARLTWPVNDAAAPAPSEEEQLARFRAARDRIEDMVKSWVTETETEIEK